MKTIKDYGFYRAVINDWKDGTRESSDGTRERRGKQKKESDGMR